MLVEAIKIEGDRPSQLTGLSPAEVVQLVKAEAFTWVDIQITPAEKNALAKLLVEQLDFHPATVDDCVQPAPFHQPKLDEEQDYRFISFLYYEPRANGELLVRELNIYVSRTYVITVHRHPMPQILGSFRRPPRHITDYQQRAVLFLHHILDVVVDSFASVMRGIQERSDGLEIAVLESKRTYALALPLFRRQREELSGMRLILHSRQALVMLRRTLSAELEIIRHLIAEYDYEGAPEASEEIAIYFRDIADHTGKYLEIIEAEDSALNHLMEVHNLVTGHRTNEIIYILTIISTVMLPLNLIVGFFGMNFENLWLTHSWWGIWFVATIMLAIALLLVTFFRARGWL